MCVCVLIPYHINSQTELSAETPEPLAVPPILRNGPAAGHFWVSGSSTAFSIFSYLFTFKKNLADGLNLEKMKPPARTIQ